MSPHLSPELRHRLLRQSGLQGARVEAMSQLREWLRRLRELDREGELGLWSWRGCVSILGAFLALLGILAAVTFAIHEDTEGLLLVIAILLSGILFVVATMGRRA